ncbi:hypothetical protein [Undibacterium sp. Xuan67W]|uniref:hypothetical protein n=1 Tax=Undibacterium sp. Xuan67W TaxID=3413057 RepID=UPI003BF196F3
MQTAAQNTVSNSTSQDSTSELTAIIPGVKFLTIAGVSIPIRQIKMGMLPDVLRALQPIAHMLKQPEKLDIPSMFMFYADECLTLITELSGQSRAWVNEMDVDDGVMLFGALLEVNTDFFIRQVLPQLTGALENLTLKVKQNAAKIATAGQTVSTS